MQNLIVAAVLAALAAPQAAGATPMHVPPAGRVAIDAAATQRPAPALPSIPGIAPDRLAAIDATLLRASSAAFTARITDAGIVTPLYPTIVLYGLGWPAGDVNGDGIVEAFTFEYVLQGDPFPHTPPTETRLVLRDGRTGAERYTVTLPRAEILGGAVSSSSSTWTLLAETNGDGVLDALTLGLAGRRTAPDAVQVGRVLAGVDGRTGATWIQRDEGVILERDDAEALWLDVPTSIAAADAPGGLQILTGTTRSTPFEGPLTTLRWNAAADGASAGASTYPFDGDAPLATSPGDLDGDRRPDIVLHQDRSDGTRLTAVTHAGTPLWNAHLDERYQGYRFVDGRPIRNGDDDGVDVLFSGYGEDFDSGTVAAFDGADGSQLWQVPAADAPLFAADLNGDGGDDAVSVVRDGADAALTVRSGADRSLLNGASFHLQRSDTDPFLYGGTAWTSYPSHDLQVVRYLLRSIFVLRLQSGPIGDLDGDDVPDLVIGAYDEDGMEKLYVSGRTLEALGSEPYRAWDALTTEAGEDANGDGADDLFRTDPAGNVEYLELGASEPFLRLPISPGASGWPLVAAAPGGARGYLVNAFDGDGDAISMHDEHGSIRWRIRFG